MQAILRHKKLLNYLSVVILIILAAYIGKSMAQAGYIRLRVLALFLPLVLIWILNLSDAGRFRLLIVAPLLVFLQMPKIPLQFSVSELILIMFACLQIPAFQLGKKKNNAPKVNYLVLLPYGLFAFAGFITAVLYGGFGTWNVFCVIPLLWMYVAMNMVHSPEDAFKLVSAAVVGVFLFLCLYHVAVFTGHVLLYPHIHKGWWCMGILQLEMGPILHHLYSTVFSTIIALGFVAANMMIIQNHRSIITVLYMLITITFAWALMSSGARGGNVAAIAGTLLMLSLSLLLVRRTFKKSAIVYFAFMSMLILVVWTFKGSFTGYFANQIERLDVLFQGNIVNFSSFKIRLLYLEYAIEDVLHNFVGNGFSYMWSKYGFDDAIVYVYLIQGTGIVGTICFAFIIVHLFIHFSRNLIEKHLEERKMLAALGVAILVCGLLSGLSSQSILASPMHSFIFWTIVAACYAGTQNKSESELAKNVNQ